MAPERCNGMKISLYATLPRIAFAVFLMLTLSYGCSLVHPRVDSYGQPQTDYQYTVPEKCEDGWDVSSLAAESIDQDAINEMIRKVLSCYYEDIHSIVLVKNGKLVLEEYFYGYDRKRLHDMHSVTKSITSILVGIANDQGIFPSTDQRVYGFFPNYSHAKWVKEKRDISVEHLITMTAGIDWDEEKYSYSDSRNSLIAMWMSQDPIGFVLNRKQVYPPGEVFTYNGGLTHLLGAMIKNTTGSYIDKYGESQLFKPLGIHRYNWGHHQDGTVDTGGGLSLLPIDMAKIGYTFLEGGMWKGKQIVSSEWIELSTKARFNPYHVFGNGYGYHWWCGESNIAGREIKIFFAAGRGGQYIFVVPGLDLVAVFTGWNAYHKMLQPMAMLEDYILPAIVGPYPLPIPKPVEIESHIMEGYVGKYQLKPDGLAMEVVQKGNRLYLKPIPLMFWEEIEMKAKSKSEFFSYWRYIGNFEIQFTSDEDRKANKIIARFALGSRSYHRVEE
jgi:CubicO group peptidase (beta-lactamase class C family)